MATLFRLTAGKHAVRQPNGTLKLYRKGQTISSMEDLVEKFPNQFVKVHADEDNPILARAKAKQKRLVIEAAEAETVTVEPEDVPDEDDTESTPVPTPAAEEPASLGTDVTVKYDYAVANGLTVYFNGDYYSVYDGEKLVKGELEDKAGVKKAMIAHVKSKK